MTKPRPWFVFTRYIIGLRHRKNEIEPVMQQQQDSQLADLFIATIDSHENNENPLDSWVVKSDDQTHNSK